MFWVCDERSRTSLVFNCATVITVAIWVCDERARSWVVLMWSQLLYESVMWDSFLSGFNGHRSCYMSPWWESSFLSGFNGHCSCYMSLWWESSFLSGFNGHRSCYMSLWWEILFLSGFNGTTLIAVAIWVCDERARSWVVLMVQLSSQLLYESVMRELIHEWF